MKNSDTDKVSFITPEIGAGAVIVTFLLTVNDNDGEKARDIVQVKVNNLPEDKKSAKSEESSSDHVTKNEIEIKEQAARPKLGTLTQKQFESKFKDKSSSLRLVPNGYYIIFSIVFKVSNFLE